MIYDASYKGDLEIIISNRAKFPHISEMKTV